jgi:hypothetical protein
MVQRPSMWMVADCTTGEILEKYYCRDADFSTQSHDKLYCISSNNMPIDIKQHLETAYLIMDVIRSEYAENGRLREDLYDEYLTIIDNTTPDEYKIFYKELSNVNK